MNPFHEYIDEYKMQLEKGAVRKAYQGLMEFIMNLKAYFKNKYPDYFVSGSIYYGHMDMTYFSFFPKSFKQRQLKIAVVFIHDTCSFEVWLAGFNKQVQQKYWKLFKESGWNQYHIVPTTKGVDAILDSVLVSHPDFSDLETLTQQIEQSTMKFIQDIENFLSHKNIS